MDTICRHTEETERLVCFNTHIELAWTEMSQTVCYVSLVSAAARRSPKPLGLVRIQGGMPIIKCGISLMVKRNLAKV
jgi:hypothetical protein